MTIWFTTITIPIRVRPRADESFSYMIIKGIESHVMI